MLVGTHIDVCFGLVGKGLAHFVEIAEAVQVGRADIRAFAVFVPG